LINRRLKILSFKRNFTYCYLINNLCTPFYFLSVKVWLHQL